METGIQHQHLLPQQWPSLSLYLLAALGVLVWAAVHWSTGKWGELKAVGWLMLLIRCAIGAVALWLVCNAMNRLIVLSTSWWIPGICIFCAIAIELILVFYRFERKYVTGKLGGTLAALRVALVLSLGLMLLQPVFAWNTHHTQERFIAVMIDDSQSMQISDQQLTDSEKLQLIRVFDESIAKPPYQLNDSISELSTVVTKLDTVAQSLEEIQNSEKANAEFSVTKLSAQKTIRDVQSLAYAQSERIGDLLRSAVELPAESRRTAEELRQELSNNVVARMVDSDQLIDQGSANADVTIGKLVNSLQGASSDARQVIAKFPQLIDSADRSFYASLPPEKRAAADKLVNQTRSEIARVLLLGDDQREIAGLLDRIKQGYELKLFRFSKDCSELDLQRWQDGPAAKLTKASIKQGDENSDEENEPANLAGKLTDIAAALNRVENEIPREQLAGILLVTDGRHNTSGDAESIARKFGANEAPVSALVIGSSRPPVDAAIVDVEHPHTVLVNDMLTIDTRVKLTGMKNRKVQAKLFDADKELAERTIDVVSDNLTTSITLQYIPTEEAIGQYRIEVQPLDSDQIESEAFAKNNSREISFAVSDNRTEILMVEGKPRWEFGYLRNLFAGRDESVQLQSVLLEPELLLERDKPETVHASASREKTDANALPADEAEWLKFDVIILGDVPPSAFNTQQQDYLYNFVNKRGGTLIVIAGQRNMPHRFGDTKLAELLPIEFEPSAEVLFQSPETEFNFRLSQIGSRHPIMHQADSEEESELVWESIPEMYWRHPIVDVKPGAAVLAYAETEAMAPLLVRKENETEEEASQRREKREQYEHEHALTVVQQFGLGRVMMMNTDRTWRLRYRVGDTHHHRLWGQVIRWASSERLQGGTDFVQVGAKRLSYETDEPIVVTAKLTDSYFTPIEDPDAAIRVYQGDKLLFSKKLEPLAGNPGTFQVDLGKFSDAGHFRIELDSPEAKKVFAGEEFGEIKTEINVNQPETVSLELVEPTADRAGLMRLTSLGGGSMVEADSCWDVLEFFAPGTERYTETKSVRLWDTWPLLALMLTLVSIEWIFRKKGGLV